MLHLKTKFLAGLIILALLVSCVPKAVESTSMTESLTNDCSLDISLADNFDQISSTLTDTTASYNIALRVPLNELSSAVREKLEANGWQFIGAAKKSRTDTTYLARYTCLDSEKSLQLSIRPLAKSFVNVVKLELE